MQGSTASGVHGSSKAGDEVVVPLVSDAVLIAVSAVSVAAVYLEGEDVWNGCWGGGEGDGEEG